MYAQNSGSTVKSNPVYNKIWKVRICAKRVLIRISLVAAPDLWMLQMSDVEEDGAADPREELTKLHRKQKKDLQAQIQVPEVLCLEGV